MKRETRVKKRLQALCLLLLMCLPTLGSASGQWYLFDATKPPRDLGYRVSAFSGNVKITFLGDCTLGGTEKSRANANSFYRVVQKNGLDAPVRNLKTMTLADDLTIANLEGVLSDRSLEKVDKEFNFIGSTEYTQILTLGGMECVTLANNHTYDYGAEGYADTVQALEDAGIAWFDTGHVAVWENDEGLLIGFVGVSFYLTGDALKTYEKSMQALKEIGCSAIITVMHAGIEYESAPSNNQKQIAKIAAQYGSTLLVGHHPHIVQGYTQVSGMPVVYSLGNCIFGGNTRPRDTDALVLQAELSFEDSELTGLRLHFYPITISTGNTYNNYVPAFLTGERAQRVLEKMRQSTGVDVGPFDAQTGAVVEITMP